MPRSGLNAEAVRTIHQLLNDVFPSQAIASIALDFESASIAEKLDAFKHKMENHCISTGADQGIGSDELRIQVCTFCPVLPITFAYPFYRSAGICAVLHAALTHCKNSNEEKKSKAVHVDLWITSQNSYCYIDYVCAHHQTWMLKGLRAHPTYLGSACAAEISEHTQPNLLPSVEDRYERTSNALQMLPRERKAMAGGGVTQQWVDDAHYSDEHYWTSLAEED
ncbi:hypothetical protein NM688_g4691 [Phlebia brevispora]|uniref:Uncharacterized protein n=1 Tax=Phlebia brevispora TaxID=194682 RepID=A0ACC1T2F2_9APHY|nr:hypothetical protein NM688_g4691 [Phlebia brevispora]